MRSFVPPIPALGASIERSERRTGIRYPASEYRLETSTISLFSEENNRHDIPFENIGSISDMFHEQLPLPVPCYDLVLVIEFAVVLRKAVLRAPPTPLT